MTVMVFEHQPITVTPNPAHPALSINLDGYKNDILIWMTAERASQFRQALDKLYPSIESQENS